MNYRQSLLSLPSRTLPQPDKPNKQVQEYINAFSKGGRLVAPNKTGWAVISPGNDKSHFFDSKDEAVARAESDLVGTQSKVFVFDADGGLVKEYIPHNQDPTSGK